MSSSDLTDLDAARARLEALAEDALARARKGGASAAEVGASLAGGLSVTVRKGEVETLEHQRDRGFSVTVYFGQRKGSASTSDLAPRAIEETVDKACTIARYTAEDPCAGLPEPDCMAADPPDLDLDHPWELEPDQAVALARDCEAAGLQADERITNTEGGSLSSHRGLRVYANTHGFSGGYASTSHSVTTGTPCRVAPTRWSRRKRSAGALRSAPCAGSAHASCPRAACR